MGAPACAPGRKRRGHPTPRAFDFDPSEQRVRPRSSQGARASEGSDSEIVKRREFLSAVGRIGGSGGGAHLFGLHSPIRLSAVPSLLIPMDDAQIDLLKAYGLTYRGIPCSIHYDYLL